MTLREFIFGLSRSYSNFLLSIGRANIANDVLYLIRLDYKMSQMAHLCEFPFPSTLPHLQCVMDNGIFLPASNKKYF